MLPSLPHLLTVSYYTTARATFDLYNTLVVLLAGALRASFSQNSVFYWGKSSCSMNSDPERKSGGDRDESLSCTWLIDKTFDPWDVCNTFVYSLFTQTFCHSLSQYRMLKVLCNTVSWFCDLCCRPGEGHRQTCETSETHDTRECANTCPECLH